ncbi:MAG: multiple sugar transport system permease protein [Candidatus Atribacteria bacterium]|uniref:Sugar ABC transporter permease n=1 Tax=Thermatribacter velox TaxID=3039681 RepID=A0ABZ2YDI7_9BACT|nr:multiple sugar transport system permease protein [Candidatus Atribacteria bacterium]MDI3530473.1 multiple sugar transport system permease protein [Candidatus Atribacteria bacterium]
MLFPKRMPKRPLYLIIPPQLLVLAIVIFPLLWAIYISFHSWNPTISPERRFVGIANYIAVLKDERFLASLGRMLYYSGVGVTIQLVLGTLIALALVEYIRSERLRTFALVVFLLPMMMAEAVVAQMWTLLVTDTGTINNILVWLGFSPIGWRTQKLALTTLMIVDIWQWTSLPLLIAYAARISVPERLLESARLDGASKFLILRKIILPYMRVPLAIAFLLRFMDSYKFLDKVFIMTYGGPGTATELPTFYLYQTAFSYFNVGYAASMSWIFGIMAVVAMLIFWRLTKRA